MRRLRGETSTPNINVSFDERDSLLSLPILNNPPRTEEEDPPSNSKDMKKSLESRVCARIRPPIDGDASIWAAGVSGRIDLLDELKQKRKSETFYLGLVRILVC